MRELVRVVGDRTRLGLREALVRAAPDPLEGQRTTRTGLVQDVDHRTVQRGDEAGIDDDVR